MTKSENSEMSIKKEEDKNNSFSLLLPYYKSDKWTNKLKRKVKALSEAYNNFYEQIEKENNPLYKTKYNSNKNNAFFQNKTAKNFMKHNKLFINGHSPKNVFNKTSTGFMNYKTMSSNENSITYKNKILNELLPPITNYNSHKDNQIYDGVNLLSDTGEPVLSPKIYNLFCISAQHKNQNTNMNKFYNNKHKDIFYYVNHKNLYDIKNLFSSKAQNEDFNKFLENCHSKDRISFFKKNDYNLQLKLSQPKDRRQISALKDVRKKQYLDYIKAKSEDNYMRFYYNQ